MPKKWLITATVFALLSACSGESGQQNSAQLTSGELFANEKDQWTLVNYWAQWCKPCIEEIPELNAVHADYDHISVYGVNYDGATGDALAAQEQQLKIAFPALLEDPAFALGIRRPAVLPTTLVIDPAGKLARTLIGPQTKDSLLAAVATAGQRQANGQKKAGHGPAIQ